MASEADLDNFERRAAEAEAQIQALEKRLAAVEKPAPKQETDLALLLAEIRRILALVNAEEKQAKAVFAGAHML